MQKHYYKIKDSNSKTIYEGISVDAWDVTLKRTDNGHTQQFPFLYFKNNFVKVDQ